MKNLASILMLALFGSWAYANTHIVCTNINKPNIQWDVHFTEDRIIINGVGGPHLHDVTINNGTYIGYSETSGDTESKLTINRNTGLLELVTTMQSHTMGDGKVLQGFTTVIQMKCELAKSIKKKF